MIKNDAWIIEMATQHGMLEPFVEQQVRRNVVSYGVSSYGYDVRLADEFRIVSPGADGILDPKNFDAGFFSEKKGDSCVIPPGSYILGRTVEYFKMPQRVMGICTGKSTYARCGIIANITPLEPEWEGFITMAIANVSPLPVRVYAREGIAQVIFLESNEDARISYKDRGGKYQAQSGLTYPSVDSP